MLAMAGVKLEPRGHLAPGRARPLSRADDAGAPRELPLLDRFVDEMPFLYGFVERMGLPPSDRDDVIQEVFLILHRRQSDFDGNRPLRPWLAGIAYRLTLQQRRPKREVDLQGADVRDERSRSPEQQAVSNESADLAWQALQKIPAKQRAVFILHEIQGQDVPDVAKALGVPRFTVYSRLREARKAFASAVDRLVGKDGWHGA